MKKFILTGAFIASALLSQAQFSLGVKGGLNLANVRVSKAPITPEINPLYNAGIVSNYAFNDNFSLQLEGLYSVKGFKIKSKIYDMNGKINYVEVPLLAKLSFGNPKAFQFFVLAGPYVAFKLSASYKTVEHFTNTTVTEDESNSINDVDYGANVGGGLSYNIGKGALFVDARYGYGINEIYKKSSGDDSKTFNSNIQIGIGYLYRFGK